jgi:hypothetical protein
MENSFVYRTLPVRFAAVLAAAAVLLASADATTFVQSQTFKAGTKIACVLEETVNSAQLSVGSEFRLRVVDTAHPVLVGAVIRGFITDVTQPSGLNRARIGFLLYTIKLTDGKVKNIQAYVVNRAVVAYNPAAQYEQRQQAPSGLPYGTVTPGPIAWQMRIGSGGPSTVSRTSSPSLGGYVYAKNSHEAIVAPAGISVTVELAGALTVP